MEGAHAEWELYRCSNSSLEIFREIFLGPSCIILLELLPKQEERREEQEQLKNSETTSRLQHDRPRNARILELMPLYKNNTA